MNSHDSQHWGDDPGDVRWESRALHESGPHGAPNFATWVAFMWIYSARGDDSRGLVEHALESTRGHGHEAAADLVATGITEMVARAARQIDLMTGGEGLGDILRRARVDAEWIAARLVRELLHVAAKPDGSPRHEIPN